MSPPFPAQSEIQSGGQGGNNGAIPISEEEVASEVIECEKQPGEQQQTDSKGGPEQGYPSSSSALTSLPFPVPPVFQSGGQGGEDVMVAVSREDCAAKEIGDKAQQGRLQELAEENEPVEDLRNESISPGPESEVSIRF